MKRYLILAGASLALAATVGGLAYAQYPRDRGNPLEDFLRGLEGRQNNPQLECMVNRRINRNGDIIWLRLDCRSEYRRYEGR